MIAYALIGLLFFKGKIENRCRLTPFPVNGSWYINDTIVSLCGVHECPEMFFFYLKILLKFNEL